jgi:hypothetical protein
MSRSACKKRKNGFRTEWAKYRASENNGRLENVNGAKLINRYDLIQPNPQKHGKDKLGEASQLVQLAGIGGRTTSHWSLPTTWRAALPPFSYSTEMR